MGAATIPPAAAATNTAIATAAAAARPHACVVRVSTFYNHFFLFIYVY
jgi:hypothetical protein